MWQDYFAQHGYLEQTAGWQLALEGLLGEALTPVAFPEKASWKAMTKDGLPLLQHSELQEHMAEAAAASFGRAISELLASEQLTMPDGLRQSLASMRTFKDTPEEAEAAEKVSIHFINRYRCHTLASVPIFLYNRSREPTINQK